MACFQRQAAILSIGLKACSHLESSIASPCLSKDGSRSSFKLPGSGEGEWAEPSRDDSKELSCFSYRWRKMYSGRGTALRFNLYIYQLHRGISDESTMQHRSNSRISP